MGGSEKSYLNLKRLADNVGLDEDEYFSLLVLFIETSKTYLRDIKSAILDGDSTKVYETTHTIRGAADNLGIFDMSEIAKEIEVRARQNILEGAEEATEFLMKKLECLTEMYH
ncbi:MAG: Hpt domain-containing protein [Syntrophaceae bacterium]